MPMTEKADCTLTFTLQEARVKERRKNKTILTKRSILEAGKLEKEQSPNHEAEVLGVNRNIFIV